MYTTPEKYVRAVEASIKDNSSKDADDKYPEIKYGRYAWRELQDTHCVSRLAASGEMPSLETYIKRCLAIDVVISRSNGDDYTKINPAMCMLFNITPEYVAQQEEISEGGAWDA